MSRPLVSVLMPVYNADRYVAEAVESVLSQTWTSFELLIADDGSTDRSREILQRYAQQDDRIRLTQQANRGLTPTLNSLIQAAQGEFVAILEHDDIALPDRLAQQVAFLQQHPQVVCVSGAQVLIDEAGRLLTCLQLPQSNSEIQAAALAGHGSICHPGAMMRRSALLQVGGYDETMTLAHDLDLWLRLGEVGELANLALPVVKYRLHTASLSGQHPTRQRQEAYSACERAWQRRGISGQFEASEPWRPGKDRTSRHRFMLQYGWWAFENGQRNTAIVYARRAIAAKPWLLGGWKLLFCALFKSLPPDRAQMGWTIAGHSVAATESILPQHAPQNTPQNAEESLTPPIVSLLMPMRNAAAYVGVALQSILQEQAVPLEVIVIDDGSTDGSIACIQAIGDRRVRVIAGPGQGIAAALNAGLEVARGEVLMRCDADDQYTPDRIASQVQWLLTHPDYAAICGNFAAIAANGRSVTAFSAGDTALEITTELCSGITRTHLCTFAMRTEVIRAIGGFRSYFVSAEDLDLQLRLAEVGRVWYSPSIFYRYRLHDTSITHTQSLVEQAFFRQQAQEFQRQRHTQGRDDLQRGCPPDRPVLAAGPGPSSRDQMQGLLMGQAWSKHAAGQKSNALTLGLRSLLVQPTNRQIWRSLLALALKPAGRKVVL